MVSVVIVAILVFLSVTDSLHGPSQENELNGKHLTITTSAFAPYVYIDHDENGNLTQVHGFVNELVLWLAAKYNFSFHYVEPADGFYGAFVNSSWNGMVRMIIDKEADMIAFPLTPTYARTLVIDFAIPFAEDPMVALIPPPNQDAKALAVVKPFKVEVWILIITSMLGIAIVTCITVNLKNKYFPTFNLNATDLDFKKHLLVAFGVICCQGQYVTQNVSHSTRIAAASWGLTSVVFVYLYSGCLISFMTVPKFRPIVETLDQLADTNELQVATLKTHFFDSLLLDAKSGTYKKLGDAIRANPQNRLSNKYVKFDVLAEKFVNGKYAVLLEKAFFLNVIEYHLKKTGKCDMSLMKEEFYQTREAFAISKGSPFVLRLLDQGMNTMRDTGFIEYWHASLNKVNKCTAPPNRVRLVPRLTISDLAGVFALLLCGLGLSTIVYMFELVVYLACKLNCK